MPPKTKRSITPQDIYAFQTVSDVRLSPDGRNVIYAVQRVERKTEKKYTNLWLAPASHASSPLAIKVIARRAGRRMGGRSPSCPTAATRTSRLKYT
ncbi:MAG: hypothetical protein MUC85_11475 [Anaerolineales bacterium]|nr:hypothetical protein [Anaerolineales bacterium]